MRGGCLGIPPKKLARTVIDIYVAMDLDGDRGSRSEKHRLDRSGF